MKNVTRNRNITTVRVYDNELESFERAIEVCGMPSRASFFRSCIAELIEMVDSGHKPRWPIEFKPSRDRIHK